MKLMDCKEFFFVAYMLVFLYKQHQVKQMWKILTINLKMFSYLICQNITL